MQKYSTHKEEAKTDDELIYMDCVASLYGRNSLGDIIQNTAKDVFIPITVGGGIRSVKDATNLLRCGALKLRMEL